MMELPKKAQAMEIHKSYWIGVLRDENDNRAVKRQFIKDLGYNDAEEAAAYLEAAEQTTFVGVWFLTDAELEVERESYENGRVSVFAETETEGAIRVLSETMQTRLTELQENCKGLMRALSVLAQVSPADHSRVTKSLTTLVEWSCELNKKKDGLSDRGQTAYVLLGLIEDNTNDTANILVLFQLAQVFVDYVEGSMWVTGQAFSNSRIMGES